MAFQNVYHHRKVADTASKACDICYKPSTSVLVTPDSKDFFYVCPGHLKERNFCTPIIDEAAVAARKKKELEDEVARVKKEYEDKQTKKKEKEKEKEKGKEKESDKEKDSKRDEKNESDSKSDTKKPDGGSDASTPKEEEPRVFALSRTFYQLRLDKKRSNEQAKRNLERLRNPEFFPSVPKSNPGKP